MTTELLQKYLKEKGNISYYNVLAKENISKINTEKETTKNEQREVEETLETINTLHNHARLSSLVKLSPICYVPAIVKHTGEYNVFFNPSYQCTLTHKQTVDYLNKKYAELSITLEAYDKQLEQLEERLNLDENLSSMEMFNMPEVIHSEKGIAIRQGLFYEIIEEDTTEVPKSEKRISRIKDS